MIASNSVELRGSISGREMYTEWVPFPGPQTMSPLFKDLVFGGYINGPNIDFSRGYDSKVGNRGISCKTAEFDRFGLSQVEASPYQETGPGVISTLNPLRYHLLHSFSQPDEMPPTL